MLRNWTIGFLGLFVALPLSCGATVDKSTGSNWLGCSTDTDCAPYGGATCGKDHYCMYPNGDHVSASATPDAGSVDGGPRAIVGDCFSPGQNLDKALSAGAVGCECPEGTSPLCIQQISLSCEGGRWTAATSGVCDGCWTPEQADFIASFPERGCTCYASADTHCSTSTQNGPEYTACTAGKWTVVSGTPPPVDCACTVNEECGFGRICVYGKCAPGVCEVNGARYSAGFANIPDPLSCNTCTCEADGSLTCTTLPCPAEACPTGTSAASECVVCGQDAGACDLRRTGCLTSCNTADDCGYYYLSTCDPDRHACNAGCQ
jgi:hypothetical protein